MLECLQENLRRRNVAELYRSYMALLVPMMQGEGFPTWEQTLERYESATHVMTREELQRADEIGRATAEAFGLL